MTLFGPAIVSPSSGIPVLPQVRASAQLPDFEATR